jgi:chromosome segregation ATPase
LIFHKIIIALTSNQTVLFFKLPNLKLISNQIPEWNVQVNVSEQKCKTFKEITENLEKSLHESEEKSQRERNRLQELCDTANTQCQQSQTIIDGLRAEIADANARFTSREAELENAISEWKSQVTEMQQETLELNAQLDRLNRELMALRSHKQELESLFSQVCFFNILYKDL